MVCDSSMVSLATCLQIIVPFVVTIVVTLIFSLYMLLDPAEWLSRFMQLTFMSMSFELQLLLLAAAGFAVSWMAERYLFPELARFLGRLNKRFRPSRQKKRKEYKILLEDLRR